MSKPYRSAWRRCCARFPVALICVGVGIGCGTRGSPPPAEIPCPAPDAAFWEELDRFCPVVVQPDGAESRPGCEAIERWMGQMLNYCEPLG